MRRQVVLWNILVLLVFFSCKEKATVEKQTESHLIEITKKQFQLEKMAFGTPQRVLMEEGIFFTGKIVPGLNGVAVISAPVEGIIKSIHVLKGQDVRANKALLEIGGIALIDLQQAFVVASAKLKQLKSDYDRAKALFAENIKTENEFMLAESNYKAELANYSALKLKLQNIGLSIANIEKGNFASTYQITTPISGQVSKINYMPGQYVSPEYEIAEVVNQENVELQMDFFEKDYSNITLDQRVVFRGMDETTQSATATIKRIGKKLNTNSNSVECFATIDTNNKTLYAINQLVSGEVVVVSDSVLAVPKAAILTSGKNEYVLVKNSEDNDKYLLQKIKVTTGKDCKGFIELINAPKDNPILTSGTYNLSVE